MRSTAIIEILDAINGMNADDSMKRQVRKIIGDVASVHGMNLVTSADRVDFARRLLDAKVSKATIRERLRARYSISRTHAYRIIGEALNCPKTAS
jgi:hypothetical protein